MLFEYFWINIFWQRRIQNPVKHLRWSFSLLSINYSDRKTRNFQNKKLMQNSWSCWCNWWQTHFHFSSMRSPAWLLLSETAIFYQYKSCLGHNLEFINIASGCPERIHDSKVLDILHYIREQTTMKYCQNQK